MDDKTQIEILNRSIHENQKVIQSLKRRVRLLACDSNVLKRNIRELQSDNRKEMQGLERKVQSLQRRVRMLARDGHKMRKEQIDIRKDHRVCMKMMMQLKKCQRRLNAYHRSQQQNRDVQQNSNGNNVNDTSNRNSRLSVNEHGNDDSESSDSEDDVYYTWVLSAL